MATVADNISNGMLSKEGGSLSPWVGDHFPPGATPLKGHGSPFFGGGYITIRVQAKSHETDFFWKKGKLAINCI